MYGIDNYAYSLHKNLKLSSSGKDIDESKEKSQDRVGGRNKSSLLLKEKDYPVENSPIFCWKAAHKIAYGCKISFNISY